MNVKFITQNSLKNICLKNSFISASLSSALKSLAAEYYPVWLMFTWLFPGEKWRCFYEDYKNK